MWGGKSSSFACVIFICLTLFPPPTLAGFNLYQCHLRYNRYEGCLGDLFFAQEINNMNHLVPECCKKLKHLDELCVPNWGWAKSRSPFRPSEVKERCSKFGGDY